MKNSDKFVDYYNKIDAFLELDGGLRHHESFTKKVRTSKNKIVHRFKDELVSMGELRNAIVHNPRIGEEAIAEPHQSVVDRIEKIFEELTNPEKIAPKFEFKVIGTNEEEELGALLKLMKQRSISQVPVYDEKRRVKELLNTNTIARWLAKQINGEEGVVVGTTKIKELIPEIEHRKNYQFVAKKSTIYEAYDIFVDHIHRQKRNPDALFITEKGRPDEKILGMLTIQDIADKIEV